MASTESEDTWVDSNKTLEEQDVREEYTLLLKKKFFFYDADVDTNVRIVCDGLCFRLMRARHVTGSGDPKFVVRAV